MSVRLGVSVAVLAAFGAGAAAAGEIVLEEGGARLSAPEEISCDALPVLTMKADLGMLGGARAAVNRLTGQMGAALSNACPEVESLAVAGEDRGVRFEFEIEKAAGWALPGLPKTPAPEPASEPAPLAAAPTPVAEPVAAAKPAAEKPAAAPAAQLAEAGTKKVVPGLKFQDLAQFFGPVRTIRDHVELTSNDTWTRVLAARAYSARPEILNDDLLALEVAKQMLNPAEFQQFLGPLAQKVGQYGNFQQLSVFDRRDLANRVRSQLRPYLDQRRQTGDIDVFTVVPVRLGEFDFDTGGFPFRANGGYSAPSWQNLRVDRAMDWIVLPSMLKTTVEQARQLDAYLRARKDPTLHLGIFMTIAPEVPPAISDHYNGYNQVGTPARVTQIALYADKDLTQAVYDFTTELAAEQAQLSRAATELARPVLDGETLAVSLAKLNASKAPEQAVVDAYSAFGQYGEGEKEARVNAARAALAAVKPETRMRLAGWMNVEPYDPVLGGLPVQGAQVQVQGFSRIGLSMNLQAQLVPDLTLIPLARDEAAAVAGAISQQQQVEIRLEADLVQGGAFPPQGEYYQAQATFAPRRVLIFTREGSAKRRLLADVTLPDTPAAGAIPFEALKLGGQ